MELLCNSRGHVRCRAAFLKVLTSLLQGSITGLWFRQCFCCSASGMRAKVQANKIAGAICISHLRCLHEMLSMNPEANTFIVLEGDVTSHGNTHQLMSAFLANWHGNQHLKDTLYCALTFSDWHSGYSQELRSRGEVVPGSIIAPDFKIVSLQLLQGSITP